MSRKSVTILECERCGAREEILRPHQEYIWGRIHFAQFNGPIWIGSQNNKPGDIKWLEMCPVCIGDAKAFWEAGKIVAGGQTSDA